MFTSLIGRFITISKVVNWHECFSVWALQHEETFKSLGQNDMNVFQTGEFEKVGFIHMESLSLFSWSGLRTSVSISLSNQGPGQLNLMSKHPWCTYNLVFCGLPFKESVLSIYQNVPQKQNWNCVSLLTNRHVHCTPVITTLITFWRHSSRGSLRCTLLFFNR